MRRRRFVVAADDADATMHDPKSTRMQGHRNGQDGFIATIAIPVLPRRSPCRPSQNEKVNTSAVEGKRDTKKIYSMYSFTVLKIMPQRKISCVIYIGLHQQAPTPSLFFLEKVDSIEYYIHVYMHF
jgi:hypothetical protein